MLYTLWKRISREVILLCAFFLPPERKRRLERWLRGKEEFRKLKLADVVIVSFGKSGRTWLRMLLSRFFQLRFGLSPSAFIGFDNLHRKNDGIPRVFFTHDNYLRDYTGNADNRQDFYGKKVAMAGDPDQVLALRTIAPNLTRGIVAQRDYDDDYWKKLTKEQRDGMLFLRHGFRTEPHFVAFWVNQLPAPAPGLRQRCGAGSATHRHRSRK